MRDWLGNDRGKQFMLVLGGAGIGKSAVIPTPRSCGNKGGCCGMTLLRYRESEDSGCGFICLGHGGAFA